jgi:hypothetical protein
MNSLPKDLQVRTKPCRVNREVRAVLSAHGRPQRLLLKWRHATIHTLSLDCWQVRSITSYTSAASSLTRSARRPAAPASCRVHCCQRPRAAHQGLLLVNIHEPDGRIGGSGDGRTRRQQCPSALALPVGAAVGHEHRVTIESKRYGWSLPVRGGRPRNPGPGRRSAPSLAKKGEASRLGRL